MKYIKLDLLTLLISLFILSSCDKKGTIGLDISPQDSIKSVRTEALTVNTVTVAEDSVVTSGLSQNPFGFMKDPVFGTTEANLALNLSVPQDNLTFGTSPTLDSAVLVLKYGKEFYGDSLVANYVINVHQLTEQFASSNYFNTKSWSFDPTVIGTKTVKHFSWNSSPSINQIVHNKPDTLKTLNPQLRIRLNDVFINSRILNADPSKLKNNAAFQAWIKGLYVTIDKTLSTGNGGITFFDLQTQFVSGLEIYYKNSLASGAKDTSLVTFGLTGASNIKHNYTGTPIQTQLSNPSQTFSTVYVQPLAGVRTKLRFPNLSTLKQSGPISVNKAELVIPVVSGSDSPLQPAPRLTLYRLDIAGQRQPVPDNAIGRDGRYLDERSFGGFYNSTDKTYTFNITSYIQDLVNKPIVQYDTYIAPFDLSLTGKSNIYQTATTAARSVLGGLNNPQSPIKLRITYTKPN